MFQPTRQNLYRKYRPQTFSELLGQDHIVKTLQSAVSQGRISHAYLFSGPRGTGKTSAARLLAKILNCKSLVTLEGGLKDACRTCQICRQIEDLNFIDIIEIDAASNNSVEDIRDMREKVKYRPVEGQYKVYIIDEVHMLSGAAFNAFLKTLEEPPPSVAFVLATTDPQKVPSTIISRCQCYDFHSIPAKVIVKRLEEVALKEKEADPEHFPEVSKEVYHVIAECVEGGFRDALSLLDQVTCGHQGGIVTLDDILEMTHRVGHKTLKELTNCVFQKDCCGVLKCINELIFRGHEIGSLGKDLLEYLRRGLLLKIDEKSAQLLALPEEYMKEQIEQVRNLPLEYLMAAVSRLERMLSGLRTSVNPRLLFEIEMTRITQREISLGLEGVERRIGQLEDQVKSPNQGRVVRRISSSAPASPGAVKPGIAKLETRATPFSGDLQDQYSKFLKLLSQQKQIVASYFQNGVIEFFKDGELKILLPSDFAVSKATEERSLATAKPVLESLFGPLKKIIVAGNTQKSETEKPGGQEKVNLQQTIARVDQEERKKTLEKPSISDALKIFGGEIVNIENSD